ncbi:MAG: hypothetical protein CL610_05985 [Anaerolineaceae bacterium]|nr:hypothetical protein [Anaerolineaceae bacterium]
MIHFSAAFSRLFVLVLVLLVLTAPVLAADDVPPETIVLTQDTEPVGEIDPDLIPRPVGVFEYLLGLSALFFAGLGMLSEPLTNTYKFITVNWWKAGEKYLPIVAAGMPVLLGVIYWITDHYGFGDAFVQIGNAVIKFQPALLALITSIAGVFGQSVVYQAAKALNLPGFGFTKDQMKIPKKPA